MELESFKRLSLLVAPVLLLISCSIEPGRRGEAVDSHDPRPDVPTVVHVGAVAPDVLEITIRAQWVQPHEQIPYEAEPGDEIREETNERGIVISRTLVRAGEPVGWLAGKDKKNLTLFEQLRGEALDTAGLQKPETYTIDWVDEAGSPESTTPVAVYRKSKPTNWVEPTREMPMQHTVYLRLPSPLREDTSYQIAFHDLNVTPGVVDYEHRSAQARSEAVHVSQVGFRSDDPAKTAFLSLWLGTGGSYTYSQTPHFRVVEDRSGEVVHQGQGLLVHGADDEEELEATKNYSGTAVYRLDFGELTEEGRYRVCVDAVGCGYPFEIGPNTWLNAFKVNMKGFYHIRSGIELGLPFTTFRRPRGYHPGEGFKVIDSSTTLMDSGDGLNCLGTDTDNFGNLIAGRTEKLANNAWGGYQDAGDWDRRVFHLRCSRLHLELLSLFPRFFASLDLGIPESGNSLPDLLDEALYNIDCYKRMQEVDGGIRGGIEAEAHPREGEASWQESLSVMAFAPDIWSSYYYAGVGARAAYLLEQRKDVSAPAYRRTAILAMEWAEKRFRDWVSDSGIPRKPKTVRYERQLAALELYRLTRDPRWHTVFREDLVLENPDTRDPFMDANVGDAAFLYATMSEDLTDPDLRKSARAAVLADADRALQFQTRNAFGLTSSDPGRDLQAGFFSTPDAVQLCRAHHLTGDARYLEAVVRATQYSLGANPSNLVYTTGLGMNPPRNPLHIDSRVTGQKAPAGITVYGQFDYSRHRDEEEMIWPVKHYLEKVCVPDPYSWPVMEAYFDIYRWPLVNEWTPQQTMGTVSYVWGYLAARP
jgi:endoglucanase